MDKAEISQCPFMKNKSGKSQKSADQKQTKKSEKEHKKNASSDEESEEEEQPRGGCPFMNSSGKKKNPNLGIEIDGGYD